MATYIVTLKNNENGQEHRSKTPFNIEHDKIGSLFYRKFYDMGYLTKNEVVENYETSVKDFLERKYNMEIKFETIDGR